MTTVTPNPHSPYADADPRYRHIFPSPFFTPPLPGHLAPAGCDRLAVVPPESTTTSATQTLPDGLCPACIAAMRGQELPEDTRPIASCRQCDENTDHDGLCAMCRMDAHDQWWPNRDAAKKALTVRQPWADAIVHGTKRTENRSRPVPTKHFGTTILIHAAKDRHASGITAADLDTDGNAWPDVRSAILGTARLTGCHQATAGCCPKWGEPDAWHWVLEDVRPLTTPVPTSGALGFWTPTPDVLDAVQAQQTATTKEA